MQNKNMSYENIKLEKMTLTEKRKYIAAQQEAKGKIFSLDEINEEIADYRREKQKLSDCH